MMGKLVDPSVSQVNSIGLGSVNQEIDIVADDGKSVRRIFHVPRGDGLGVSGNRNIHDKVIASIKEISAIGDDDNLSTFISWHVRYFAWVRRVGDIKYLHTIWAICCHIGIFASYGDILVDRWVGFSAAVTRNDEGAGCPWVWEICQLFWRSGRGYIEDVKPVAFRHASHWLVNESKQQVTGDAQYLDAVILDRITSLNDVSLVHQQLLKNEQ